MRRLQLGFAELEHDAQSAALRRVRQRALAEIRRRELLDGLLLLALAETEERGGVDGDSSDGWPKNLTFNECWDYRSNFKSN